MLRISYATDLHLSPATRQRAGALVNKMTAVAGRTDVFVLGGDTFSLYGPAHWDALVGRVATEPEIEEITRYSAEITREFLPSIIKAAQGRPVFMLQGNADAIAIRYITMNRASYPGVYPVSGGIFEFNGFMMVGLGGIEANDPGALSLNNYNPNYEGVASAENYQAVLDAILRVTRYWDKAGWRKAVLLTHQPAKGYVDLYDGKHWGSEQVLKFIRKVYPALHLAGHVHDAPTVLNKETKAKEYRFDGAWELIDGRTLTINSGGDTLHDPEIRMTSIDLEALAAAQTPISLTPEQI